MTSVTPRPDQYNNVIKFPDRGPFAVRIDREGQAWRVVCRAHGWLFGSREEAVEEASSLARGFGVAVDQRLA